MFAQYVRQADGPPAGGEPAVETGTGQLPGPSLPPVAEPPPAPPGTVPGVTFPPPPTRCSPGQAGFRREETGIFAGPNSEARRTDTVRPGERLALLDARDGWVRVASPQDRWGWVPGELVQVTDGPLRIQVDASGWRLERPAASKPASPAPPVGAAVVGEKGATLYLIPATAARVLGELAPGEPLEVLDRNAQWVKVRLSSGEVGWTQAARVEQAAAAEDGYRATERRTGERARRAAQRMRRLPPGASR